MLQIPFDSFALQTVIAELQPFVGGKVQEIRQVNEFEIAIGMYSFGVEGMLLISCHSRFFRTHLTTRRTSTMTPPPQFLTALRSRILNSPITSISQSRGDRVAEFCFGEDFRLIAELIGTHSNLILLEKNKIVGAAKWIPRSKSSRPVVPGAVYHPVPQNGPQRSRFLDRLIASGGSDAPIAPVISPGNGAYPVSVASLGLPELLRDSMSVALEQHYAQWIPEVETETLRNSLVSHLERVIRSREGAIDELSKSQTAAKRAATWQLYGELILTYQAQILSEANELEAWDYDGNLIKIALDPELNAKQNSASYFDRAKRAKARIGIVNDQFKRLTADLMAVKSSLVDVQSATRLDQLRDLKDHARLNKWFVEQRLPTRVKEDRPYEGHRIRELIGPGGFKILYGENAESNDYLTLRVAKPNDFWLHVRGGTSAHVVVQTVNKPERVQKETLLFAAKIAVQNSASKHGGYVSVDYTLKKHVRRPRSAPKGSVMYTHEKTLEVFEA